MLAIQRNSWSQSRGFAKEQIPIFDQKLLDDLYCKKFKVKGYWHKHIKSRLVVAGIFLKATSLHYPPCSTMSIDVETGEFVNGGIEFLIFDAVAKKLKWVHNISILHRNPVQVFTTL